MTPENMRRFAEVSHSSPSATNTTAAGGGGAGSDPRPFMASTGIYIFRREVLVGVNCTASLMYCRIHCRMYCLVNFSYCLHFRCEVLVGANCTPLVMYSVIGVLLSVLCSVLLNVLRVVLPWTCHMYVLPPHPPSALVRLLYQVKVNPVGALHISAAAVLLCALPGACMYRLACTSACCFKVCADNMHVLDAACRSTWGSHYTVACPVLVYGFRNSTCRHALYVLPLQLCLYCLLVCDAGALCAVYLYCLCTCMPPTMPSRGLAVEVWSGMLRDVVVPHCCLRPPPRFEHLTPCVDHLRCPDMSVNRYTC